jgi:hypothetical protein
MTIGKTVAVVTASLLLSSAALSPALAHKAKNNSDSSTIGVTASVTEYCAFSGGLPGTLALSAWDPQGNTGGTGSTASISYSCNGSTGIEVDVLTSNNVNQGPSGGYDCDAKSPSTGGNLYYLLNVSNFTGLGPNGAIECNTSTPSGYGYIPTAASGSFTLTGTVDTGSGSPPAAADYADTLTIAINP